VSVNGLSLAVEPAFRNVPPYADTLGPDVAGFCASIGYVPDAEQEMLLGDIFAVGKSGRSAAFEVAAIACRQNLKTAVFKMAALGWLFVTDERLVVWSAHEWDTVKEAVIDLDTLIGSSDALRRKVRHIYRGNGDEAIVLRSGARLIFKTRTKVGGRGLSGNKVILDEGFALRPAHMGALLPTLSAQRDPQVLYGSSAGQPESDVLRGVRDRGRAGDDRRLAYTEFCAPPPSVACAAGDGCTHALTAVGCGCDDPANWARANPALGRRISAEYIADERRALPPAEFGRERMGWWDDPLEGGTPIPAAEWTACADRRSQIAGPLALAFAVAPDSSAAAVAVAGRRADGLNHGELVEHRPGTGWLVGRVLELAERHDPCVLVINPAGAAGAFEKELAERKFATKPGPGERRLQVAGMREFAQACGALAADVANGRWRHLGQRPLDDAVEGARTRPLADAWAWSWKNSAADIGPLEAVTLARHGFMTHGVLSVPDPEIF
jgi:hypothetical protein